MFYDTREELGQNGILYTPVDFTRDDMQYAKSSFVHVDITVLDIWPAIDVTDAGGQKQRKLSTFTSTFKATYYEIDFDVEHIDQNMVDSQQRADMESQGALLTAKDDARLSVGAAGIISDRNAHNTWMQSVYAGSIAKPPAGQRQELEIAYEDVDPFTFTRYEDQWGWRWKMNLHRASINALALYIQDSNGNYLYTTGALLDDGNGSWYTECPAGQADATPENVYFKWILGSAAISQDFVYEGNAEELSGVVRSDGGFD